ncbi:hypothetical protein GN316_03080 [Xylophilus sp. Kf1]|nr:hypothetical protein [Xylophilus sp. Kf1]
MTFKLRATNLQNAAPGNTATLKLPVGANAPTLDKILLTLGGGLTAAHITRVRGKANGRTFFDEGPGTLINLRDNYRGVYTAAGFLTIDFTEAKARNGAVEQLLASVPMSQLQDLAFEFDIASSAPPGMTMVAQIQVRQPTANPFILKRLNTTQNFGNSGQQIMYLPTGGAGGKMKRIYIHEQTPGTLTDVEFRVGNTTIYETSRAQLEQSQKQNGLTPQAGVLVVDFIEDGNLSGVMDTGSAANVEMRLTSSAGNTYTVYYEFIDPIGRL